MEVVLVYNRTSKKPLGTEHQVERFADGRFADVVSADQERMAVEVHGTLRNAPKILDDEPSNAHHFAPEKATALARRLEHSNKINVRR
jgi:hypothetical protein